MGAILSFNEMISVNSIDGLTDLYAKKGLEFPDEKQFLEQTGNDWQIGRKQALEEAHAKEPPKQIPSLDVKFNNALYKIYGISHTLASGSGYRELVNNTLSSGDNWLVEYNMKIYYSKAKEKTEIQDVITGTMLDNFRFFGETVLLSPIYFLGMVTDLINPSSPKKHFIELNEPLETVQSNEKYPTYVDIGLREKKGKKYDWFQQRSAYQAEFSRAWKLMQDKNILVGALHGYDIKYFLLNGVKDKRIIDLAWDHAELLQKDPDKYKWEIRALKFCRLYTPLTATFAATMFAAGVPLHYFLEWYLNK